MSTRLKALVVLAAGAMLITSCSSSGGIIRTRSHHQQA